jgi:hypothetical protein
MACNNSGRQMDLFRDFAGPRCLNIKSALARMALLYVAFSEPNVATVSWAVADGSAQGDRGHVSAARLRVRRRRYLGSRYTADGPDVSRGLICEDAAVVP